MRLYMPRLGAMPMSKFTRHSTMLVTTILQDADALKKFHDERISAVAEQLHSNPAVISVMVVHSKAEPNAIFLESIVHWSEHDSDTDGNDSDNKEEYDD